MNQTKYKELLKLIRNIQNQAEREAAELYLEELRQLKIQMSDMFEQYGENRAVRRDVMMKYGRLKKMEDEFVERIKILTRNQVKITKKAIKDVFAESYYYRGFALEVASGMSIYSLLSTDILDAVINNDMDAITWDERINENNNVLIRQVKETIMTGLIQGAGYTEMAKNLTNIIDIGRNKAVRIIQTETHRASEDANLKVMEQAKSKGVMMKKRWLSTLDSKTRDTHKHLDGQTIDVDDYFVSKSGRKALAPCKFGDPKEDINCRCTTIAIFEDLEPKVRRARDKSDKGEIIAYTNYSDWKKNLK